MILVGKKVYKVKSQVLSNSSSILITTDKYGQESQVKPSKPHLKTTSPVRYHAAKMQFKVLSTITTLLAAQQAAAFSSKDVVDALDEITDLSADANDVVKDIGNGNLFTIVPVSSP